MLEPNAGLLVLPKLKVDPVFVFPPNALLVFPKPPPVEPKPAPALVLVELPNSPPPPVFVALEPKGFAAGLLPKREPEVLALLPKPVDDNVSSDSSVSMPIRGGEIKE